MNNNMDDDITVKDISDLEREMMMNIERLESDEKVVKQIGRIVSNKLTVAREFIRARDWLMEANNDRRRAR